MKDADAFTTLIENPTRATTSLLFGAYSASLVGRQFSVALGEEAPKVDGTNITYDRAIEVLAVEIDRRFPVPT